MLRWWQHPCWEPIRCICAFFTKPLSKLLLGGSQANLILHSETIWQLPLPFTFKIQPDYLEIYRIKLSEAVNFVAAWKMVNYKLKRWVTLFLFSFRSKKNHENKLAPKYWVTDDSNWHTKERIKATNLSQTFSWGNFFRWTACYEIMKFFMDNSL